MAERKSFLVRIDGDILESVRRWADAELRSLNGQIEYLLRKALADAGRLGVDKNIRNGPPSDSEEHPPGNE